MRVAFTLIGGAGWTGGINYLENLLSALSEQHESKVSSVLFAGTNTDPQLLARLSPYLIEPPVLSPSWDNKKRMRFARLASGIGLQRDYLAEFEFKRANIDLVFQHAAWYGCRFKLPTLAWIADFQHRRLPFMFSKSNYYWRDVGYWALSHCATQIMVSSEDAKKDCEKYYPRSCGRVTAVPFSVKMNSYCSLEDLEKIRRLYKLPDKFLFMPNQLWKHKNHINVIEALREVKQSGRDVIIVASGNPTDGRHPDHHLRVSELVNNYGLDKNFRFLGLIPYQHILPLMRLSAGVVNASLFEGWSTTVEEAKAVGAPLLLSELPIHREQADGIAVFFDPFCVKSIASVLGQEWSKLSPGPRLDCEQNAIIQNGLDRKKFAINFGNLVKKTLQNI